MKNHLIQKMFAVLLSLGLLLCCAFAEEADYASLLPEMDLICAASQYSDYAPESVPGEEGILSASFVNAFIQVGQSQSPEAGVAAGMMQDPEAQAELLSSIFAAELPELESVPASDEELDFIGFYPKAIKAEGENVQIVGEIYTAAKPIREMSESDFADIQWLERGIFELKADAAALNGYRVTGFSVGTDLAYEDAFQTYAEEVAVEYMSPLGFRLLYPACFDDELLVEDENGVSAEMPDGSARFFVKKTGNAKGESLSKYAENAAAAHAGSILQVKEDLGYATISFSEEGFSAFQVIYVTDEAVFTAELSCLSSQLADYSMYTAYLENSFGVDGLSQG